MTASFFVTFQNSALLILSPKFQLRCATLLKDSFVSNKQQIKVWGLVFFKEWRNVTNILMSLKNNNDKLIKCTQSALTRLLGLHFVCCCLFSPLISNFNLVVAIYRNIIRWFCSFVKLLYKIDGNKKTFTFV